MYENAWAPNTYCGAAAFIQLNANVLDNTCPILAAVTTASTHALCRQYPAKRAFQQTLHS